MEEKRTLNYEELMSIFAEIGKKIEKSSEEHDKRMAEHDKEMSELREQQKEHDKRITRIEKLQEENAKGLAELKDEVKVMAKEVKRLNTTVCGVEKSNGLVAEESFYNSLNEKKTFGGIHFDEVKRNMYGDGRDDDDSEGEYDIVMLNGNSICIIEAKYKARPNNVSKLVNKQVKKFKKLFPQYSKYNYYLGIGGMSFTNGVEKKAKELGVGILKLKGDVVEVHDENLKVY